MIKLSGFLQQMYLLMSALLSHTWFNSDEIFLDLITSPIFQCLLLAYNFLHTDNYVEFLQRM